MPTEPHISANNRVFILQALSEKRIRLDGRRTDQYRPVKIEFGKDGHGYADVSLGKTRVAARTSVEVSKPNPDRKFDGLVTVSSEFSPMVAPSFEAGRPTITEALLSRHLERSLIRSSAIDTESLCLIAGAKCFHLRVDLHIIAHDGNLLDASSIACLASLRHFRRPDFEVSGEEVTIFSADERELVPLSIRHFPYTTTISLLPEIDVPMNAADEFLETEFGEDYYSSLIALVDANRAEETIRVSDLVISANKFGEICAITKDGTAVGASYGGLEPSGDVDPRQLLSCVKTAVKLAGELDAIVTKALQEDEAVRSKGGLLDRELKADNDR